VAFLVNAIALVAMRASGQEIVLKPNALWLLALAGIAASGVDIFGLLAYERELWVTSSVIIGGTWYPSASGYGQPRCQKARRSLLTRSR
jgi:hypothetical protein